MPGLDPEIAVHRLNIKPDAKPIKQAQRRFHPLLMKKIEKKVKKLKDVGEECLVNLWSRMRHMAQSPLAFLSDSYLSPIPAPSLLRDLLPVVASGRPCLFKKVEIG